MSDDSLQEFLATVELFSAFTPDELAELASHAETRHYEFGDTVVRAGDASRPPP